MDLNQVLEVPDTPDRLATTTTHNSNHISTERRNDASMNNRITSKDYANERMRNQPRENGNSTTVNTNRRLFIHHPNSYSKSPVSHSGSSYSLSSARPTIGATRPDKGKALCNPDIHKSNFQENGNVLSGINRVNNASRKGVLSLNRFPPKDSCKLNNTLKSGSSSDNGTHHKAESNASSLMQPCMLSRAPRKTMLVRNGCISPHNIAKSKDVKEKHETGIVVKDVHSTSGTPASEGQSNIVDIKDLIAEAKDSRKCKGKEISHSHHSSSFRESEPERWRTTHNHRKQRDTEQRKKEVNSNQNDRRNERDIVNLDELEAVSSSSRCDPLQIVSSNAHLLGSNNRPREGPTSRNIGKRVISLVDESPGESSSSRSKRNKTIHGVNSSNPPPDPNTHLYNNNEDPSVKALQVEADEMLARELQEQLYNEEMTPAVETNEMDLRPPFGLPMEQDTSSRNAAGRPSHRRRGPATANVQVSTSRRPSIRRRLQPQTNLSRLRSRFFPQPRTTSTRRNSIFPANMDVDMRMQILETLEDIGNIRMSNRLPVGREFNEDDYEMLLALDEDNHHHGGATSAQINNLPESTVQAENLQECSICLETPTIGETIRHLPCLHRFHKACIDQWLQRKTSCPVCKSSIT